LPIEKRHEDADMKEINTPLAIVSNKSFAASTAVNLHHYDISSALQTTLEFDELIAIFCQKIQNTVAHSGYEYQNHEFGLSFARGVMGRHSCTYVLKMEDQQLGELKLTRSHRFLKDELQTLESLLCCLIYPLRNATLFRQAIRMAYTDPLTKTNNRTAFNDILLREIKRCQRTSQNLSLIFVDIDFFKTINDTYGHECGDLALSSIANRLMQNIRGSDAVFRYGGEEFVVLLSDTHLEDAEKIAERIREDIENHSFAYGMEVISLTASLGVAALRGNDDCESLINRADRAMYRAKHDGRNRVCIDTE
jgi:diguanylate cyclase (GGDEF)-like protein